MSIAQSGAVTGHAGREPGQGPFMRLHLTVWQGSITNARFETYACPACQACGQELCILLPGLEFNQASQIDHQTLRRLVGHLPRSKQHCIDLALEALEDALEYCSSQTRAVGE